MKTCKKCGHQGKFAKFCDVCGTEYIEEKERSYEERVDDAIEVLKELKRKLFIRAFKAEVENAVATDIKKLKKTPKRKKGVPLPKDLVKQYKEAAKLVRQGKKGTEAIEEVFGRKIENRDYAQLTKYRGKLKRTAKSSNDGRVKRMHFISSRGKQLVNQLGISYEEAHRRASIEWNDKRKSFQTQKKVEEFKLLSSDTNNKILLDILKNVINDTKQMTRLDANAIGYNSTKDWRELVIKILSNSQEIANHFGVPNKFKTEKIGDDLRLIYR